MNMIWSSKLENYVERCPACGYSYATDENGKVAVGNVPFLEVKNNKDLPQSVIASYEKVNSDVYSCDKPVHICPKCGTMGIQIG